MKPARPVLPDPYIAKDAEEGGEELSRVELHKGDYTQKTEEDDWRCSLYEESAIGSCVCHRKVFSIVLLHSNEACLHLLTRRRRITNSLTTASSWWKRDQGEPESRKF